MDYPNTDYGLIILLKHPVSNQFLYIIINISAATKKSFVFSTQNRKQGQMNTFIVVGFTYKKLRDRLVCAEGSSKIR